MGEPMRRLVMTFAACVLVTSCSDRAEPPAGPRVYTQPTFPPETFTLFGVVRDEAGRLLPGALAEVSGIRGTQITNLAGYFALSGLRGRATVRVWKEQYEIYQADVMMAADTLLDVRLSRADYYFADSLVIGQTIRSFVPGSAAPCDPVRWDAKAPCRSFSYTAPASGRLEVAITWSGEPELDATITTISGAYVGTSSGGFGTIIALAPVSAGITYAVRVNSYYDFQRFTLRAEFRP